MSKKLRCIHRHTEEEHPNCFENGIPKKQFRPTLPKVLLFDIETAPLKAYIWQKGVWNTNVHADQVVSEWYMLCWSAKWLFDKRVYSDRLTGSESIAEDDSRISKSFWELLNQADIVIAHNGDGFDIPNMNTRFIINGLPPTKPYQTIDTLKIARKQFGFTHNSLNALARVFGFDSKLETNFQLWKDCINGSDGALRRMEKYNRRDVTLLEEIYLKLRPWIKGHPNLGLYVESDKPVCPVCGSSDIEWTGDYYYTQSGKYATYRCKCGAYGRARYTAVPKEIRKNLGTSLYR